MINDIDKDIYWVVIEKFFRPIISFAKILISIAYIFVEDLFRQLLWNDMSGWSR